MERMKREPSDIMVTMLDLSEIEDNVLKWLHNDELHEGKYDDVVRVEAMTWGVVDTPEGLFALCTEGVGPDDPISEDNPLELEFWIRKRTKGDTIPMFPVATAKVSMQDLERAKTDERVPLHEFIRSFGRRLEMNYSIWKRRLEDSYARA